jgi:hypothetical protein
MSSEKKTEANRRNALASTGPRTLEGKAAVAVNAVTHGLRAQKSVLYNEDTREFHQLCVDLHHEWQPATSTEANLVEQMAIAQFKLARLESLLSSSFYQSWLQRVAVSGKDIMDKDGLIRPFDVVTPREDSAQRLTNGLSQHIVRVERAWFKAMETLLRLQDRRDKLARGEADSTGSSVECHAGSSPEALAERVAAASAGLPAATAASQRAQAVVRPAEPVTRRQRPDPAMVGAASGDVPDRHSAASGLFCGTSKNDKQSHRWGEPNAPIGPTPVANEGSAANRKPLPMAAAPSG